MRTHPLVIMGKGRTSVAEKIQTKKYLCCINIDRTTNTKQMEMFAHFLSFPLQTHLRLVLAIPFKYSQSLAVVWLLCGCSCGG